MMYKHTKAEEDFFAKRDKEIKGLKQCKSYYNHEKLVEQIGCKFIRYEELTEGKSTYQFLVYEKDGRKIVYNKVYVEKEGGMYFQSLFTEDGEMPIL